MADVADDKLSEGKLDLVPMIDCIMLLLLFFILTSRFVQDDKALRGLLPTNQGQATTSNVDVPVMAAICIYPAGLQRGSLASDYAQAVAEDQRRSSIIPTAWLRIGTAEPIAIDGTRLMGHDPVIKAAAVEEVHAYVARELAKFEHGNRADRGHQCAVTIHCFSGLSWGFALLAYDAVRGYELSMGGDALTTEPMLDGDAVREVDFAPPRIRDYSRFAIGQELEEIINMR